MIGPSLARKSSKRNKFQPTSRIHSGPWNIDAIRNTFDGSRIKTKRGPEILKHTCSKFKQNNSAQPNDLWIENNPGIEGPPEFDHAHWENTFTKNCGCSMIADLLLTLMFTNSRTSEMKTFGSGSNTWPKQKLLWLLESCTIWDAPKPSMTGGEKPCFD